MMPIQTIKALAARRAHRLAAPLCAAVAAASLIAGCASTPPDHFYTLRGRDAATLYKPSAAEAAPFYIEVGDATVPDEVARAQMVVDLGDGRVNVAEHQRWIAPLQTEISAAVSEYLTRSLHTIDVYRAAYPAKQPVYRIGLTVRRFISVPGSATSIDMVWTVRRTDAQNQSDLPVMTCRSVVNETIGAGYDAIAQGHRRALDQIAADIGGVITQLGDVPGTPPSAAKAVVPTGKTQKPIAQAPAVPMPTCP
ncbi:PqiC family protein [Pararobbsia silviterrae]|uniref:Membrane integrity-associated transporter subunit PqiC n=1 Tax=Pararobbsia silviterrae TaxID=1792498 RepID=A0A494XM23_9BURK|nr:PqiC family protein [Pararobbsia silviterrae]RKP48593.1 membrane integrity-associated transporter subunit PqiC [Pararobbsia silviterrae]